MAVQLAQTDLVQIEDPTRYDAIIVGAGAAGGLAAALLCAAGLDVLLLDAGFAAPAMRAPMKNLVSFGLRKVARPGLIRMLPRAVVRRGERMVRKAGGQRQPIQTQCHAWPTAPDLFVDDLDNPYATDPDKPFHWFRVHALGGRMVVPTHGRQYLRLGPDDFAPRDGRSPAWPFGSDEIDPWYEMVERHLGLSGGATGSRWIPPSLLSEIRSPDPAEAQLIATIGEAFPGAEPMLGQYAPPLPALEIAAGTGRLSCRQGAVVDHVEIGADGEIGAVCFHDRETASIRRAVAPKVLLAASTIETTRILLASERGGKPGALGRASDALGRNLMDHVTAQIEGNGAGLVGDQAVPEVWRCLYLPHFEQRHGAQNTPERGFGVRIYRVPKTTGESHFTAVSDSEMLPRRENRVTLSARKDAFGIAVPHVSIEHSPEERSMAERQIAALRDLAAALEVDVTRLSEGPGIPGASIHECGTARMGTAPENSVVDPQGRVWETRGLYVIDGSVFPSEGNQNPTLTIMALAARVCGRIAGFGPDMRLPDVGELEELRAAKIA
ncbi:choline dehydrogenase-like flavoprotein [Thioclava sp. ES.031]|uniref:GMC oxidoreductase n=1 Tax=Thioclava sp. ES.031 TaxID=1798203 RepID=UPI000BF7BE58|nr:GMC family oxidoreductase [Thioclava sp. ES.031]PFG63456.1 choline dehydrogenase-like flavoprotein [Thioclava sp. ES.031]